MESQDFTPSAKDALESISQAKRATAELSKAPPGYYLLLGVAMALLTIAPNFRTAITIICIGTAAIIIALAVFWYSKTVPTWSYGNILVKSAWPYWVMAIIGFGGILVGATSGSHTASIIAAAITIVSWGILGPIWDKRYREQLSKKG